MNDYTTLLNEIELSIKVLEHRLTDLTVVNDRIMRDEELLRIYRCLCETRILILNDSSDNNNRLI
jgi:hypothetical protein